MRESLFVIKQVEIERFKSLLEEQKELINAYPIHQKNAWVMIMNTWFLIKEKPNLMDSNKQMVYSSNFYCLDLLKTNQSLQASLKTYRTKRERIVIAYFIGSYIYNLLHTVLNETEEGRVLIEKEKKVSYYEMHLQKNVQENESHDFYQDQKVLISAIVSSHQSEHFQKQIQSALQQARHYISQLNEKTPTRQF